MRPRWSLALAGSAALVFWIVSTSRGQSTQHKESIHLIESVQGQALYTAYCAVCHGADGKGGGPMAKSLRASTPDLTRIAARNKGKFSPERVQRIIAGQEPVPAGHGMREMPIWGPIFSQVAWDQDLGRLRIYNLTKYIEQLQEK